ncbi:MAG: 50S ribosomal protein L27 [Candidatus Peribacteria bacterium]|jgi:large subunit ribosomal protein L27|nr:50S ribosomal protein L27 [Candidatus Peribacteria bacterium]
MAHKKAAGSAKNLRDSQPKYRGVKLFGGQKALAGNIIIRQKGSQYECGENTYLAADFTIHALVDGIVAFKKKNFKRFDGRTYLKTVVQVLTEATSSAPKQPSLASSASSTSSTTQPIAEKAETGAVVASEKKTPAKKPATKKQPAEKPVEKAEKKASTAKKSSTVKKPATKKPSSDKASA